MITYTCPAHGVSYCNSCDLARQEYSHGALHLAHNVAHNADLKAPNPSREEYSLLIARVANLEDLVKLLRDQLIELSKKVTKD